MKTNIQFIHLHLHSTSVQKVLAVGEFHKSPILDLDFSSLKRRGEIYQIKNLYQTYKKKVLNF